MRTLLWFTVGTAVALGIVIVAAPKLTDAASASAIIAAAAICTGAGVIAMIPPCVVARRHADWLMHAGMGAILVRLMLTSGAGLGFLLWRKPTAQQTYLFALGICYVALLAVETGVILLLVKRHWRPPGPSGRPPERERVG